MAHKMLGFVTLERQMPDKRPAEERRGDFGEIYQEFTEERGSEQASRCSQCGVPFCHMHCPLYNYIPDWLKLAAEGRMEEAYEVSSATNTFPEICGRICPQDRLCEGLCTVEQSGHGTVTIGAVERFITETAFEKGWVKPPFPERAERSHSVGIIGAGPGGLAAAERLRRQGYQVHVYDRHDRAGGLLIYGIPNFKLDKEVVLRRIRQFEEAGIQFHLGVNVGTDVTLEELRQRHDAVLVATGVYKARDIGGPGAGLQGIVPALDYLITANKIGLGDRVEAFEDGNLNAKGKKVVVIGGGDTAMDCVRTALRQGAESVKCLYRRNRANMPGSDREVSNAEEEGAEFIWLAAPEAFLGEDAVSGVRAVRMHLGVPDASGRQTPQVVPDSSFTIHADLVIKALGFEAEDPTALGNPDLAVSRWGTITADPATHMTNLPGVFAVGDIVRGASLVVWAIRDGREAAASIGAWLARQARDGEGKAEAAA